MEAWCPIAPDLIAASIAPKTKSMYEKAWQVYLSVLQGVGSADKFTPQGVLQFIVQQKERGRSLSRVKGQLSAIAFFAGLEGGSDPTKDIIVKRAMQGWERLAPKVQDNRRPRDASRLQNILGVLPQVCVSSYEAQLFRLAYSLAFFGAFQISELIPSSKSDTKGGLNMREVVVAGDLLKIRVRRSKTDPLGKGVWIQLRAVKGADYCPVALMGTFMQMRSGWGDNRLLLHADGTPLTRFQFTRLCKLALALLGEEHSFCIGAATTAATLGFSPDTIKRVGRWRSSCFEHYFRTQLM